MLGRPACASVEVTVRTAYSTALDAAAEAGEDAQARPDLVHLRDGSLVTIRAVASTMRRRCASSSLACARKRDVCGSSVVATDTATAAHAAADTVDGRCGLVAHDENGMIVGHAVYIQLDPARAEVAVEVADHLHGRGLGTILIERLATIAEQRGITHFVAEVLCENRAMLDVFREGFDARVVHREGPEERVEFLTSGWRLARERFARTVEGGSSVRCLTG